MELSGSPFKVTCKSAGSCDHAASAVTPVTHPLLEQATAEPASCVYSASSSAPSSVSQLQGITASNGSNCFKHTHEMFLPLDVKSVRYNHNVAFSASRVNRFKTSSVLNVMGSIFGSWEKKLGKTDLKYTRTMDVNTFTGKKASVLTETRRQPMC